MDKDPKQEEVKCTSDMELVLTSFLVVEEGMTLKVGNGEKMRIGIDPWMGCGEKNHLPREMTEFLILMRDHYESDNR